LALGGLFLSSKPALKEDRRMFLVTILAIYLIIWWVVLFGVLPIGVNQTTHPQPGHDAGAPQHPYLARKLVLTTLISAAILFILYLAVKYGVLPIHALLGQTE
jgi:predicted secreted protein